MHPLTMAVGIGAIILEASMPNHSCLPTLLDLGIMVAQCAVVAVANSGE
jgi:hypothetical protein